MPNKVLGGVYIVPLWKSLYIVPTYLCLLVIASPRNALGGIDRKLVSAADINDCANDMLDTTAKRNRMKR